MNIPNLPHPTTPLMDPNNKGSMNHAWQLYFNQLTSQLQQNTQQSLVVSAVSSDSKGTATEKMNQIASNANNVGGLVYNADTNLLYVNINGTFKQIVTL
jgi:uncharacterized protein YjiK